MSSYRGLDLFGSGPHRFSFPRRGQLVILDFQLGFSGAGSTAMGLLETDVIVRGRLVAPSDAALWTLREAIIGQIDDPPAPGDLIDHRGRVFSGMSLITFEEEDRTDRGRTVSVAYRAVFRRFT